jgi:hypothetical protein
MFMGPALVVAYRYTGKSPVPKHWYCTANTYVNGILAKYRQHSSLEVRSPIRYVLLVLYIRITVTCSRSDSIGRGPDQVQPCHNV